MNDLWLFAYGSLMWKRGFDVMDTCVVYLEGYVRRFWQGSTDHRGIPEAPGRVVTLVEEPEGRVYGLAYRLDPATTREVLDGLDFREKGGYEKKEVLLRFDSGREPLAGTVYVAAPGNPNFLGPLSEEDIARQAATAVGPSGPNHEYVHRLAEILRAHALEDEHVFAVSRHLEALCPG